ncbi:LacI family transcriptional regulator [Reticulibacter mediterranei]|uniref:LacI family transcriptional regulator n=1 Tax=Reticulibacter mediterranei TaxID=2778369 RepID=A0A8J3IY49_9CHLR|nr:LacI family DNA-binding transcriptional regulator [Reticulibacter mediterranei]GHP00070.1 LacI family transcriptional regulator [Reticulibacter mediterranei]
MSDQNRGKIPTIHDVARIAGVGIGTVSRVINHSTGVKPATRQRVQAAIEELRYSPNLIARSMISRNTGAIGIIVPFFTRPFFIEVLQGAVAAITHMGRELVLYNVETNDQRDRYFRDLPGQRKVDGLLVISLSPDDVAASAFRQAGMPVVLVDAYHPLLTSLVVDNIEGAYQAVKCLIAHGHRRIGFINGVTEGNFRFNQANDRLIGLHRAIGEAGLLFEPELVLTAPWDRQGGKQAALQLLARADRPTAIFAASDVQAIGVLEAARSLHLSVPADLSLIGYDDIEMAEVLELSTVQQPMKRMGELGVQKLLACIGGTADGEFLPELIRLQPSLMMRHTVIHTAPNV